MQAVIAIPASTAVIGEQKSTELVMYPVAGVPLLRRIVLTASRAAVREILLICPAALSHAVPQEFLHDVSRYEVESELFNLTNLIHTIPQVGRSWGHT